MKRLVFEQIALVSLQEQKGRRVRFHPTSTVIRGDNGTGKSCLLKSLYWTLGAEPPNVHPNWRNARVASLLHFAVDGVRYRALRHDDRVALFDADDRIIGSFVSITAELAPAIARIFSFKLMLPGHDGVERQAPPAFLFLPFYLDQDQGWGQKLASFANLQQFSNPKPSVVDFHFGIRPHEYYEAKSRLSENDGRANALRSERDATQSVMNDVEHRIGPVRFAVDIEQFKEETERLLARAQELSADEQRLRDRMSLAYASVALCKDQLNIASVALDEARADRAFAQTLPDTVQCPTCRAEYQNGFAARFGIATDEDQLMSIIGSLREQLGIAERNYAAAIDQVEAARAKVADIATILNEPHGDVVLRDVLKGEGTREVFGAMRAKIAEVNLQIGELDGVRVAIKASMASYDNRDRRARIESYYASVMARLLDRVGVVLQPSAYRKPASPIYETGSSLSRALLAFFLASARTIREFSTCALCPLVIDSPRQQDQDGTNWERIRECIRDERAVDSQLILATSDDGGTDFGGDVLTVDQRGALLVDDQFGEIAAEIRPLIERSLRWGVD